MKAIIKIAFIGLLALNATNGIASNGSAKTAVTERATRVALTQKEADAMVKRVYEIRSLNAQLLSKAEKREIRNELLNIKERLVNPGGIYISGGALLLIIILLIIFF